MRRFFAFLVSVTFFASQLFSGVAYAEENIDRWAPEQQYNSPNWPGPGYMGFGANQSGNYLTPNYLLGIGTEEVNACKSMDDPNCGAEKNYAITTGMTLPTCQISNDTNCIYKFEASTRDNRKLEVKPVRVFKPFNEFEFQGDLEFGLPNTGNPTIYDIPEAPHPGGTKYMVIPYYSNPAGLRMEIQRIRHFNVNKAAEGLRLMIFAISIYEENFQRIVLDDDPKKYSYSGSWN